MFDFYTDLSFLPTEQLERERQAEEEARRERERLQRLKDEERRRKEEVFYATRTIGI